MNQANIFTPTDLQNKKRNSNILKTIKNYDDVLEKSKTINMKFIHTGSNIIALSLALSVIAPTSAEALTTLAFTGLAIRMISNARIESNEIKFEEYLNKKALYLGISEERIETIRNNNIIPSLNVDTNYYYDRSHVIIELRHEINHAIQLQEIPYMSKFHKKTIKYENY
jgi:hypothetical protein